jgi:hypothetical protein
MPPTLRHVEFTRDMRQSLLHVHKHNVAAINRYLHHGFHLLPDS